MVIVFKHKVRPDGTTEKYSWRLTVADVAKSHERLAATYAACVNSSNVRGICQDAAEDEPSPGGAIEVDLDINDVPGAYYFGTPAQPGEPGFRMLYGYVPKGLDEFGFPQHNERGERMLYFIRGNAPGRRDAGQIWGKVYTQFLIGEGFVQSVVDRRVFYLKGANGRAIITTGVHVDDCISSVRDRAAGDAFNLRWCARFGGSTSPMQRDASGALVGHFLGLRIRKWPGRVCLDSPRLVSELSTKLAEAFALSESPKRQHVSDGAPLHPDALARLRAVPGDKSNAPGGVVALASEDARELARSILGIVGFVVIMYRPDGSLAHVAISQQISQNFTNEAWRATLQLGAYIVATGDLALTFRQTGQRLVGYADSSSMNAGNGRSWGGFGCGRPGSGLTHYRCLSPRHMADSSGGNELIVATLLLKELIGDRILAMELGLLQPRQATDLFMDASVVLSGVSMDRVSRESRYLATRLAMLRQAVADGVITLRKIDTHVNLADIFTKPLVGAALKRLRALVLGLQGEAAGDGGGAGDGRGGSGS